MLETKKTIQNLRRRRGQGMTEYIIIVGLIAILLVGAITKFKGALENTYNASTNSITANVTSQIK
jgi:Flp pilus assembly pilin Flp